MDQSGETVDEFIRHKCVNGYNFLAGIWLILFDVTKSLALPTGDKQALLHPGAKDCLSFGNLDISVDLNLTDDSNEVRNLYRAREIPNDKIRKCDKTKERSVDW